MFLFWIFLTQSFGIKMKNKILIITCIIWFLCCHCAYSQLGFVDIRNNEQYLDSNKTNLIITISTSSCHNCYLELNKFLSSMGMINSDTINIITLSFLPPNSLKDISERKIYYNQSKQYFPNVKNRYFYDSSRNKDGKFLNTPLNYWKFPYIFVIDSKGNTVVYDDYQNFIKYCLTLKM